MTDRPSRERGVALLTVLLVLVVVEVALLATASRMQLHARALRVERGRVAAKRLARSGIAVARVQLQRSSSYRGTTSGELAEGSYRVEVVATSGGIEIVSDGRARGGRTRTLRTPVR